MALYGFSCGYSRQRAAQFVIVLSSIRALYVLGYAAMVVSNAIPKQQVWSYVSFGTSVAQIVVCIIFIGCHGLACESVWKNCKPKLLIPWLIVCAFSLTFTFKDIISLLRNGLPNEWTGQVVSLGFGIYYWIIIYKFYCELTGINSLKHSTLIETQPVSEPDVV